MKNSAKQIKELTKIELQRAFRKRSTLAALMTGLLIAAVHLIHNLPIALKATETMMNYFDAGKGLLYPRYVFTTWIGGEGYSVESFLYYLALPLAAAMPFSSSLLEDISCGFSKNICIRVRKTDYLTAKYIAVFVVSGTVVFLPLLVNLMITSMFLPSLPPQTAAGTFITANRLFYRIYSHAPYLYAVIYLLIDFIAAGFLGTIGLVMNFYTSNRLAAISVPFIGCIFLYTLTNLYGFGGYSLTYCLQPSYGLTSWITPLIYLGIFLTFGIVYFIKGRKWEVL